MPAYGLSEHKFLQIPALAHEILNAMPVCDTGDILLNDRSLIQIRSGIVRRRTNELHPSFVGLVIGAPARKGGKEGMVNIDDGTAEGFEEIRGKHLHVAGQDNEVHPQLTHQGKLRSLRVALCLRTDGDDMEGNPVTAGGLAEILVVRHHRNDIARELSGSPTKDQIMETMIRLRDEESDTLPLRTSHDPGFHPKHGGELLEGSHLGLGPRRRRGLPLNSLKKYTILEIPMLVCVQDIAATGKNPTCSLGDKTGLIRTVKEGDERAGLMSHAGGCSPRHHT